MSQLARRAKSSQLNIPAVSDPTRTKLKSKRPTQSPAEAQEGMKLPNYPGDPDNKRAKLKGRERAWSPDKFKRREK